MQIPSHKNFPPVSHSLIIVVKKKGSGVGKRGDGGVAKGISQMEQQIQAGSHVKTAGAGGGWVTPPGVPLS